jgi:hypothetical protein
MANSDTVSGGRRAILRLFAARSLGVMMMMMVGGCEDKKPVPKPLPPKRLPPKPPGK